VIPDNCSSIDFAENCVSLDPSAVLRVAVLFSGGEAPGMNALLRAIVRVGLNRHEGDPIGVKEGFAGLVRTVRRVDLGHLSLASLMDDIDTHDGLRGVARASQELVRLDRASVSGLLGRGGILLGASRCPEFHEPAVRRQVIDLLISVGVRGVIVCGGDGSMAGAARLAEESDLRVIGIPATIENDLVATESSLGFDTAVNTITWAVSRFTDHEVDHPRILVLEVIGRNGGELARLAALASGAEVVVPPESGPLTEPRMEEIAIGVERAMHGGRRQAIVLVAEGVALDSSLAGHDDTTPTVWLALQLQAFLRGEARGFPDLEVRPCMLGHLQREGAPSVADRILAARFAGAAWKAMASPRERSGVLGVRGGELLLQDFEVPPDPERTEAAEQLDQLRKDMSHR
jgi:6-phosphofructokinase 1